MSFCVLKLVTYQPWIYLVHLCQVSDTHHQLLEVLSSLNFNTQEFILSPLQFGVPYSRPRYFCLVRIFRYPDLLYCHGISQPLFSFLFAHHFFIARYLRSPGLLASRKYVAYDKIWYFSYCVKKGMTNDCKFVRVSFRNEKLCLCGAFFDK